MAKKKRAIRKTAKKTARREKTPTKDQVIRGLRSTLRRAAAGADEAFAECGRLSEKMRTLQNDSRLQPFVWRTAAGRAMLVTEMDEGHLRNTISYLSRRLVFDLGTKPWLSKIAYSVEALNAMLKEAKSRGIEV